MAASSYVHRWTPLRNDPLHRVSSRFVELALLSYKHLIRWQRNSPHGREEGVLSSERAF